MDFEELRKDLRYKGMTNEQIVKKLKHRAAEKEYIRAYRARKKAAKEAAGKEAARPKLEDIAKELGRMAGGGLCVRSYPDKPHSDNPFCSAVIPPANWVLRPYQTPLWKDVMQHGKRRAVLVAHRRSGKDDVCLHILAQKSQERVGTYWYMLPEAEHARKVIWDAINPATGKRRIDEAFPAGFRVGLKEQEMSVRTKNRSVIQIVGSDNYNRYVGSPPVGIVMSEYAISDPAAWAYISPILEENKGWCIFNGTPRGRNHFRLMYDLASSMPEDWHVSYITARETGIFSEMELKRMQTEYQALYGDMMGRALFRQELLCDWDSPNVGAIYGDLVSDAETGGRVEETLPTENISLVDTAWDIGGTTAIWFFQRMGSQVRVIDYYQAMGVGMDHYAEVLSKRGYRYGSHFFPWDIDVKHDLLNGLSRKAILENLGISVNVLPSIPIEDSISAGRAIFPRCVFSREKTNDGMNSLLCYHKSWDAKRKVLSEKPVHDFSSHASNAFEILARAVGISRQANAKWQLPDYGIV